MPLMLEKNKAYKTKGGMKVEVKAIDPKQVFPVVGAVYANKLETESNFLMYFTLDGRAAHHDFRYDISAAWTGWE